MLSLGHRRWVATTTIWLAWAALLAEPALGAPKPPAFDRGYPVTKRSELFRVEDLQVGDRGIGYTVFRGAAVESFEVEVLGIMEGMLGPHRDIILARLIGPQIEFTGVISGMSGSPVYFDGKLLGAVSYRFGTFSKEAIAGITPIETMFDVSRDPQLFPAPPSLARQGVSLSSLHAGPDTPVTPLPRLRRAYRDDELRPIDTPITLAGFAAAEADALKRRLEQAGLVAMVGAGGGASAQARIGRGAAPRGPKRVSANVASKVGGVVAPPIGPASPIAAVLMRGDMDVAGTGTVTFLDGDEVLAFGHPFFGYGHVAFPMATAAILNTLATPLGSYKMSAQSLEVGAVIHDRLSAIGGRLGQAAPMVPVTIAVSSMGTRSAPITTRVEIVDHELWLPTMLGSAIASAASDRIAEETGGAVDLDARFVLRERGRPGAAERTLVLTDTYTAGAPSRPAGFAAQDVASMAAVLLRNGLATAEVESIAVTLAVRPTVELAWLESALPRTQVVQPGSTLEIEAKVRPYRSDPVRVPISVAIPADAHGELEIVVGGAAELDARDEAAFGERVPDDLDDLLGILAERRASNRLYARVYLKRPGVRAGTEILSSLPPSMRLGLEDVVGVRERALTESVGPKAAVAAPGVIIGMQTLKILVAERALP